MPKVRFHHDLIDDDFIFEKGNQYPVKNTIIFNQIIGETAGGQTKVSKIGKSEQFYHLNFKNLSKTNGDDLKTWLEDSSIDWRREEFYWYTGKMVGTGDSRVEEAYKVNYYQGDFNASEEKPDKYNVSIILRGELVMTANRALKTDGAGTIVVSTVTATELEYLDGAWTGTGDLQVTSGGTSTSTGSITGTTALTFTAGGSNQNASLVSSGTGITILKPGTDSVTGIQLQNAAGTNILNADTTNSRIGIGTAGPDATLESLNASAAQLRLTHTDGTKYVDFTIDTNSDLLIKPTSTGQIKLQPTTDSTDFFQVLDANGGTPVLNVDSTNERVGIGIATPTEVLDVVGNIKLTGNITTGSWTGAVVAHEYGGLEADVNAYNGLVKISGGATSAVALPLTHENGGLEADVSAYAGLVKITGGATSAVTVTAAGEALLDDANAGIQRATLGLVIGTNVLAEQTIGTLDDNLVEVDHAGVPGVLNGDYAKWTAAGLEGRSAAELRGDISVELNADVTDATNVAAAGAVMDGDFGSNGLMKRTGAGTYGIVTDASTNWTTGYNERRQWDGGNTNLVAATGRTSLGLVIGTNVQAHHANLAAIAAGTWTGAASITTLGTVTEGTIHWNCGGFNQDMNDAEGFPYFNDTAPQTVTMKTLASGVGVTAVDAGGVITLNSEDGEIDHDSLLNYAANEHFTRGGINLADLADVAAGANDGDVLTWNAPGGTWQAEAP